MLFLAEFSVIKPDFGLFFWTVLIFGVLLFLLYRMAFKPIVGALEDRTKSIEEALSSAENARAEMANLQAGNEKLLMQAREEGTKILQEAKAIKDKIVKEAEIEAKEKAARITSSAMIDIENRKKEALIDVKNQVGAMALEIAEKVLRQQLSGNAEQEAFVTKLSKEINLN